jgi:hypothetical protein
MSRVNIKLSLILLILILTSCKPTGVSINENKPLENIQTGITDDSGYVEFFDPSTNEMVEIKVVDIKGDSLPEMEVVYKHGINFQYEAFFIFDKEGNLAAADFHLHNSGHTIEIITGEISPVNPDKAEAIKGYINDYKLVSKNTYIETIPGIELQTRIDALSKLNNLLLIFLGRFPLPSGMLKGLNWINEFIDLNHETYNYDGQWDMYELYDADWGFSQNVFVQSQSPLMQSPTINIDEVGFTTISLLAIDPTNYPEEYFNLPGALDHTIFMAGPTDFSDIIYRIKVDDALGNDVFGWHETRQYSVCIQDTCNWKEIVIGELFPGKYTLYYSAEDEVGNSSGVLNFDFYVSRTTSDETTEKPPIKCPPPSSSTNYSDFEKFKEALKFALIETDQFIQSCRLNEILSDHFYKYPPTVQLDAEVLTKDIGIKYVIEQAEFYKEDSSIEFREDNEFIEYLKPKPDVALMLVLCYPNGCCISPDVYGVIQEGEIYYLNGFFRHVVGSSGYSCIP